MGTILALRRSSWFVVWMGLELNMMGFVPFVGVRGKIISGGIFKYFLIQVVGSLVIFLLGLLGRMELGYWIFVYDALIKGGILIIIMALKIGARPFHGWVLSVRDELDWVSLIILLTWQKLAPLGLIIVSGWRVLAVLFVGILRVLVGGIGGLNQLIIKQLMVYSSIGHLGWISVLFLVSWGVGLVYFLFYTVVRLGVIIYFIKGYSYVRQFYSSEYIDRIIIGRLCLNLFSLGGLPPLLGFYPKWIGIVSLLGLSYFWLVIFYLIIGLITLYFYLRLGYIWFLGGFRDRFWIVREGRKRLFGVLIGFFSLRFLPLCLILFG